MSPTFQLNVHLQHYSLLHPEVHQEEEEEDFRSAVGVVQSLPLEEPVAVVDPLAEPCSIGSIGHI